MIVSDAVVHATAQLLEDILHVEVDIDDADLGAYEVDEEDQEAMVAVYRELKDADLAVAIRRAAVRLRRPGDHADDWGEDADDPDA